MQQNQNKGPKHKTETVSKDRGDVRRYFQRKDRKTSQKFWWVMKNKEMDLVEGSTPSEMEKETADAAGAGNVEAPAPTARE
jgi:hypothetical protein